MTVGVRERKVTEEHRAARLTPLYAAAVSAGCSDRQAAFLVLYAKSEKLSDAAARMGIKEQSAKNLSARLRRRLDHAPHLPAAMARILLN